MSGLNNPDGYISNSPQWNMGAVGSPIFRALPDWFGIPAAVDKYCAEIDHLPTWLAYDREMAVGFVSVKQHNAYCAEIYVMGVLPEYQRRGLGRALLNAAQSWLRQQGTEYLQVKTLGPSRSDENYAQTRAFYEAAGFRPLEEIRSIWDEENPCLIMILRL